jgi:hypothetical protein
VTRSGSRRPRRAAKALVGIGLLSLALASSGGSMASPAASADNASPARGHCIVHIDPVLPGEAASKVSAPKCFATFKEAIAAATSGTVQLPSSVTPRMLSARMLRPQRAAAQTVISVDYRDSGFSGISLTWYVSGTSACATNNYSAASMPSGWNDEVSSSQRYDSCTTNPHYEHVNFGGAIYRCTCSSMGVMNDKTSSEKWT